MKVFNLGYTTGWQPWKTAAGKSWLHHDTIFKYLKRYGKERGIDIQIQVLYPQQGSSYYKDVLDGKFSRLMNSVAEYEPKFYDGPYLGEVDGAVLEFVSFNDIEMYDGRIYTKEDQFNYYKSLIEKLYKEGKHIIWYDADNYLANKDGIPEKFGNYAYKIFNECFDKNYKNQTLVSPMELHPYRDKFPNFLFVPFSIDKEKLNNYDDIKPKSQREYITKYVGNNYMRAHFHDYFCALTEYGKVIVHGAGWRPFVGKNPKVEYAGKFALTAEKSRQYYQDSVVGLYGNPDEFKPFKHYTLRIREFIEAGVFIIPEDTYIKDHVLVPGYEITVKDLDNPEKMRKIMNLSDEEYIDLIKKQRDIVMGFFDCELYVNGYAKALGLWEVE